MNEEEIIEEAKKLIDNCDCWLDDDSTDEAEMEYYSYYSKAKETIQGLLDLCNQGKEKNKKLEEVINNLAKGVRYLGTNEELTTEDIIKMFSPEEIKIDFDDFMKRWENEQHKKANLKDKVIDRMAKQISCLSRNLDNATNFERVSEEEYNVDFIKQYYLKKARGEEDEKTK